MEFKIVAANQYKSIDDDCNSVGMSRSSVSGRQSSRQSVSSYESVHITNHPASIISNQTLTTALSSSNYTTMTSNKLDVLFKNASKLHEQHIKPLEKSQAFVVPINKQKLIPNNNTQNKPPKPGKTANNNNANSNKPNNDLSLSQFAAAMVQIAVHMYGTKYVKSKYNTQLQCLPPKQLVQVTKHLFKVFLSEYLFPMANDICIAPWSIYFVEQTMYTLDIISTFTQTTSIPSNTNTHETLKNQSPVTHTTTTTTTTTTNTDMNKINKQYLILESHLAQLYYWFNHYSSNKNSFNQQNLSLHTFIAHNQHSHQLSPRQTNNNNNNNNKSTTSSYIYHTNGYLRFKEFRNWAGQCGIIPHLMSEAELSK